MKIVNNRWQGLIDWGERRLPRLFYRRFRISGELIWWSKWITRKDWDDSIQRAEELNKNLKFDE